MSSSRERLGRPPDRAGVASAHGVAAAAIHRCLMRRARRPAAEQHDPVAADLGRVALVAVLVVPLPRLQAALDVDLLALGQVLGERFGRLAPEHDAVPLGLFLPLAGLVVPDLGRRHVERGDRGAAWRVAQLGVAPEIADQNHFVHAAHRVAIVLHRLRASIGVSCVSAAR